MKSIEDLSVGVAIGRREKFSAVFKCGDERHFGFLILVSWPRLAKPFGQEALSLAMLEAMAAT